MNMHVCHRRLRASSPGSRTVCGHLTHIIPPRPTGTHSHTAEHHHTSGEPEKNVAEEKFFSLRMENYRLLAEIGRGSQGTVATVRHLEDGLVYVLKRVHIVEAEARRLSLIHI